MNTHNRPSDVTTIDIDSLPPTEAESIIDSSAPNKTIIKLKDDKISTYKMCYFEGSPKKHTIESRFIKIKKVLCCLVVSYLTGKHRSATANYIIRSVVRLIKWGDSHNLPDIFQNKESFRLTLRDYSQHLYRNANLGNISNSYAGTEVNNCLTVANWAFDETIEFFLEEIKLIRSTNRGVDNPTEPPPYETLKESYSLNKKLFEGLSDFLIAKRDFPHQIALPKEKVWIIPMRSWGATDEILQALPEQGKNKVWNYRTGKMYTIDEAIALSNYNHEKARYRCRKRIHQEKINLLTANNNLNCWQRIYISQWAHDSFVSLFAANTSANESSICDLLWDDSLQLKDCIASKSLKFRTIKYRAHGRNITFEIRASAIGLLDKYLALRKHILQGREFKYLFLSIDRHYNITKHKSGTLKRHYLRIRTQLYPKFRGVTYREWRAEAGALAFNAAGVDSAAAILQTSPRSIIRNYSKGSIENWEKDLTVYFNSFTKELKKFKSKKTPIGHCNGAGTPKVLIAQEPLTPDCTHYEGCLNCEYFSLHADEEDIRKIISMQYTIIAMEPYSKSKQHFDYVFKPLLTKIESILSEISKSSKENKDLVNQVKSDVFEHENLTDYWQGKLDMLFELGILA